VTHKRPARVVRFPADVCADLYGTGLDEERTSALLAVAAELLARGAGSVPVVRAEPPVRSGMKWRRR
jgi:hypothetical protein